MQRPELATPEAGVAGSDGPVSCDNEREVGRILQICNACRYCEGYCAVFQAMTRRLEFSANDISYLANLCHNCGACLYACQYAPPHEFSINVPQAMARLRGDTYVAYAWPAALGTLYRRNGLTVTLALAGGLVIFLIVAAITSGRVVAPASPSDFYAVFPHNLLVSMFAPVFLFALLALTLGVRRFWRDTSPGKTSASATGEAAANVLRLKYLDGGHGKGCNNADDAFSLARRRFHHLTFYGFLFCLAATAVATLYHFLLGLHAPYPLDSLPVILGTAGGVGLLIGPAGLLWLNVSRDPLQGDIAQRPMDRGFIALLILTSLSGLLLLAARATAAMPVLLVAHLGVVMALFITLPYGKFAHGVFRAAALLQWAVEKRQPSRLQLGDD